MQNNTNDKSIKHTLNVIKQALEDKEESEDDSLNVSLFRLFWKKDNIKAPTTPRDAASVAVAIPTYIDPITANIKTMTGINWPDCLIFWEKEKVSSILGMLFLFSTDHPIT